MINGNYLRGTIDAGQTFVMVCRRAGDKATMYGTYMNSKDGSAVYGAVTGKRPDHVKPLVWSYTLLDNGRFNISKIGETDYVNLPDGATSTIQTVGMINNSAVMIDGHVVDGTVPVVPVSGKTTGGFELNPHVPVDKQKMYAGVWYDLTDLHDNVLKWKWFKTHGESKPFNANVTDWNSPNIYTTQVTFVPFNSKLYKIVNGSSQHVTDISETVHTVNSWILDDPAAKQSGCNGKLDDPDATNCYFTGNRLAGQHAVVQLKHGFDYCTTGKNCSDGCLGICKNGKVCAIDTSANLLGKPGMVCTTGKAQLPGPKNTWHKYITGGVVALLVMFALIAVIVLLIKSR